MNEVIKVVDCSILCGRRAEGEQNRAYAAGWSKVQWPDSPHNKEISWAVDTVPYPIDWYNMERFHFLAGVVLGIAAEKGIKLKWGGHFKSFFDGPHYEIETITL